LEDLIEEIVGNILDEDDEEEKNILKTDKNTYIVDGAISLENFNKYFNISIPKGDYDTLSGYIIGQIGRIPTNEEKLTLKYNDITFKVENVRNKRITKVKLYKEKDISQTL
jgi:putative hemolysin